MEGNNEFRVVKIGFFKKVRLSITKFERYPEMATEGVGRAFLYLLQLMIIFSIVLTIGMMYNFNNVLKHGRDYIDENISEINYKNGILNVVPKNNEKLIVDSSFGTVIVDTNTDDNEEITQYENNIKSKDVGIIWLKNKVVIYANGIEQGYSYNNAFQGLGIISLSKADLINYLSDFKIYLMYFIAMAVATFLIYLLTTLIDVLVLSLFGLLTSLLLRIKIRYRAIFNMSIYALTISILLKMIYISTNMFIDFEIKYFDFMYSAIGYICLVASIFMLKSDIIRQQIELMKAVNEKKEEEKEEEQSEEKEEKENEEKENKKQGEEDEEPKVGENEENQGSEA